MDDEHEAVKSGGGVSSGRYSAPTGQGHDEAAPGETGSERSIPVGIPVGEREFRRLKELAERPNEDAVSAWEDRSGSGDRDGPEE